MLAAVGLKDFEIEGRLLAHHHDRMDPLAPFFVGTRHNSRLEDFGVAVECLFHLKA